MPYQAVDITGDPELEARHREWLPVVEIDGERAFVYYLDEPVNKVTNMQLAVQLNRQGNPEEIDFYGSRYPVYTLTTVVPAREEQVR